MRLPFLPLALASLLLLAACGGGSGSGGGDPVVPTVYVDAVNGSNTTGTGEIDKPFKTIKRGLQGAAVGTVVRVLPGTYDAANGETFPIRPGFGVTIIGTTRTLIGRTTWQSRIVGGAPWSGDIEGRLHATIVPNSDNQIQDLAITNPQPFVVAGAKPAAVLLAISDVTVERCLLHDSDKGIRFVGGVSNTLVTGCTIVRNGVGLFPEEVGTGNRVERSRVHENGAGVMAFADGLDLGGGLAGSAGLNAFAGNGIGTDVVHFTGTTTPLHAANCFWDANPPTRGSGVPSSLPDADLWEASGPIVTTNPGLFVPTDPFAPPPIGAIAE